MNTLHINQIEDSELKKLTCLEDITFLLVNRAREKRRERLKTKYRTLNTKGDRK